MGVIRDRIRAQGLEGAHGTPEEIGEWLCESIAKWTPEQKAAARAELNRKMAPWVSQVLWERDCPARPYTRERRN